MFSRIGSCIKYEEIGLEEKLQIIDSWYSKILNELDKDDRQYIETMNIHQWFRDNASRYNNMRLMKSRIENAVYDELAKKLMQEALT